MAEETQVIVKFVTQLPALYKVPETDLAVPAKLKRLGLSQVINHLLALDEPRPFDFIIKGELLRTTLQQHLIDRDISAETVLEIEYTPVVTPPESKASIPHKDWVSALDGGSGGGVVSGSYDGLVQVWTDQGECSCSFVAHEGAVHTVAVVPDARRRLLFTGGQDHGVLMWRLPQQAEGKKGKESSGTTELVARYLGHTDAVTSIAVSPDSTMAVSSSWDGNVHLWRAGKEVEEASQEAAAALGPTAAAAGGAKRRKGEGIVHPSARAVHQEEAVGQLVGHLHAVAAVCWPQQDTVVTGGWDHSVRKWDASTGANTATYNGSKAINSVAVHPGGGQEVAFGASEGTLRVWDPRSRPGTGGEGLAVKSLPSHTGWITSVSWSPTSPFHIITGSHDKSVKVWDTRGSIPLATVVGHEDKVLATCWMGAAQIASGGADCKLQLYSMDSATSTISATVRAA